MSHIARLLKSAAIVGPLVACGQASAGCWHGLASCSACTTYQTWGVVQPGMAPVFPVLAPVAVYPYQAAPAAWGTASYPHQVPAAVSSSPGGLLDDCDGYAQMAPIADYSALLNSRMLAAHIYQNLGYAAQKYGMRVGLELAAIMYRNATRLEPTERELRILEQIVAQYISQTEAAPPPRVDGDATETVQPRRDGDTYVIRIPRDIQEIRIQLGDRRPDAEPSPNPPEHKPDPEESTPPDDGGEGAKPKGPGEKVL